MGQALEQIKDNVAFQMVMHKVQTDAVTDFANAALNDEAALLDAKARMAGLTAVLDAVEHFVQDGRKVARETQQDPAETGPQEMN